MLGRCRERLEAGRDAVQQVASPDQVVVGVVVGVRRHERPSRDRREEHRGERDALAGGGHGPAGAGPASAARPRGRKGSSSGCAPRGRKASARGCAPRGRKGSSSGGGSLRARAGSPSARAPPRGRRGSPAVAAAPRASAAPTASKAHASGSSRNAA